jgi:hypothetical protein
MKRLVLISMLGIAGCLVDNALKAVDSVPRAISESSRRKAVAPWVGRYRFLECAPTAPDACWSYDVAIDSSGTATVRADGPDLAIHVVSKPESEDGTLRLPFAYYIDGNPDDGYIHAPFEKRRGFPAGELLATMGRARDGRTCLVFAALRSSLRSRMVCAP